MAFRIPQETQSNIVYLYPDEPTAIANGKAGGSGFLVGCAVEGTGGYSLWVVTNKHVIESGAWTARINKKAGGYDLIEIDDRKWIYHQDGDDLAIAPISLSMDVHQFTFIGMEWLLTKHDEYALDIGPGDPCFVVGRFSGREGKEQNIATVRFGQISQSPVEKIRHDGFDQESFMVEIRSLGGYCCATIWVRERDDQDENR